MPTFISHLVFREQEVVGQEHEALLSEGIDITNPAKALGVASFGNGVVETDNLIALQAGGFVDGLGANPLAIEALPGSGNEEGAGLMQMIESPEIQVAAIHQVNGAGFPDQLIENVDLVNLSAGRRPRSECCRADPATYAV